MPRARNPNREKAFIVFKERRGEITSKEIAKVLNEKVSNINLWRSMDHWKEKLRSKVGAPFNNQNAVGNKGGYGVKGNQNSRRHGLYSKLMPAETYNIFEKIEDMEPLEILWNNIKIKYAAILRSQKIMYVKDHDDITKELKKNKVCDSGKINSEEYEYEIQFAWDKQANFLRAQSTAMSQLANMIKKYEELIHTNWDMATEEQKSRIEKLKVSIDTTKEDIRNRKEIANEKLKLEKERFEHTKTMDDLKVW